MVLVISATFPFAFLPVSASGLTSVSRSAASWTADATPLAHLTSTADFVCRDHHTHPLRGRDTTGREFQNDVPTPTNRRHPPAKMSTPSAKELAAKFEMMARENSVDSTPPPVSTSKSPSTKVLAAKFENISSTENIAPPPKSPKKETKTEAAPPPKSPAKTPPLTSPLASPPASPLRPKMAFPLGQNMANEAAWARSVEALEAGVEEKNEVPEAEPEPAAKPAKFNPKAFGANQPKCPKCNKTVYFAERVVGLNGTEWHKGCMRCSGCEKTLGSVADITDHKGEPYCKVCYAKNFGPKGTGRAGGGTIFHTA